MEGDGLASAPHGQQEEEVKLLGAGNSWSANQGVLGASSPSFRKVINSSFFHYLFTLHS